MRTPATASGFALTRWTLVERTRGDSPEARAALRELCEAYYAPVVAFLRFEGRCDDSARELTHEFFARLLSSESIGNAQPDSGRFRSYLLGAVKHFVINKRREAAAAKRGGSAVHISIGSESHTSPCIEVIDSHAMPPDAMFDREWALAIIDRSLLRLETEWTFAGREAQFAALKPWISPGGTAQSQSAVAAALKMPEGAVKVAIHRLRRRFRELVRADIAQTLNDPADLDAEMQNLVAALAIRDVQHQAD
jgi:RNA polymerase sigma-70 factor (ECF subfamily)